MSTTPDTPTVECAYPDCSTLGRKWEFHHGKYCSNECETKHDGRKALAPIKYDHTRCFTCFRELKTINPPKPDSYFLETGSGWTRDEDGRVTLEVYRQDVTATAACGFQFLTEHAGKGEQNRAEIVGTGTICRVCGATDHTDHYPGLSDRAAIGRLVGLLHADDDRTVSEGCFHQVYERTADIDLAAGEATTDES